MNDYIILTEKRNKNLWRKLEKEKPSSTYRETRLKREYKTTLDIDKNDKDFIRRILDKIEKCEFCDDIDIKLSSSKGVHIIIYCLKKCDICRLVYDDFRRFAYDQNRPYYAQNILFQKKELLKVKK